MCGFIAILVPNFITARVQRHGAQCKHNLTQIGMALGSYAKDHEGHYPESLQALTQARPRRYLETLPTCPAAGKDTYRDYQVSGDPDAFSFSCSGNNHANYYYGFTQDPTNYPRYNNREGLVDHP